MVPTSARLLWQKDLDEVVFEKIMLLSDRHPHYVNHLCDVIWSTEHEVPDVQAIELAWYEVCEEEHSDLVKDFLNLSGNQKKVMKYIAVQGGESVYSSAAARGMDIAAGSVRGAVEYLLEKDFIQKQDGVLMLVVPLYRDILREA